MTVYLPFNKHFCFFTYGHHFSQTEVHHDSSFDAQLAWWIAFPYSMEHKMIKL